MILILLATMAMALTPPTGLDEVIGAPELLTSLDAVPDGVIFWRLADDATAETTEFLWCNRASVDLAGLDRDTLAGAFSEVMAGGDSEGAQRWITVFSDALHDGSPIRVEGGTFAGSVWDTTVYPISKDVVMVQYRPVGQAKDNDLTIGDREFLSLQLASLRRSTTRAKATVRSAEKSRAELQAMIDTGIEATGEDGARKNVLLSTVEPMPEPVGLETQPTP